MSVLQKLTEGIVGRSLHREGAALLEKWEATGLLEGIENDSKRQGMARLLENQASQLLKEASSMAAGDVEGFASVAFPIVRRVFGGLLANDLVSVQPMSLPSGLIFFMDFTYTHQRMGIDSSDSIYGGGVTGSQIQTGVTDLTEEGGGFYNLSNNYSHATGTLTAMAESTGADLVDPSGKDAPCCHDGGTTTNNEQVPLPTAGVAVSSLSEAQKKAIRWDPDILGGDQTREVYNLACRISAADKAKINLDALGGVELHTTVTSGTPATTGLTSGVQVRRLTELGRRRYDGSIATSSIDDGWITLYFTAASGDMSLGNDLHALNVPHADNFKQGDALGSVVGTNNWPLEEPDPGTGEDGSSTGKSTIAEIDIKVESIAVTAMTKKLKAKWSPELGQDLNAYHNLDAEVELTQVLSEQIALEIDREILNDLVKGAKASTYYWSRSPGLFVKRTTGAELGATAAAPDFTGTVSEWYETLIETINDVSAQIHRKTLRGGANFLVTSPEVANILEFTAGFRASVTHDTDRGSVGAVNIGSVSRKFDVYVDPYFPRNVVLVGRKGGSFLESGYVYAPYVPLQVTPTIFGTEDFVPRKGVMTRYAKKMVRPDMYGLVIVRGLLGEAGAS